MDDEILFSVIIPIYNRKSIYRMQSKVYCTSLLK